MEKIKLEEWRMKNIGELMIKASKLHRLSENERQKLFVEISRIIDCFGLYETAEKLICEKIEEFIPKYKLIYYNIKFTTDNYPHVIGFEADIVQCNEGKSLDEIHSEISEDIVQKRGFSRSSRYGSLGAKWNIKGGD